VLAGRRVLSWSAAVLAAAATVGGLSLSSAVAATAAVVPVLAHASVTATLPAQGSQVALAPTTVSMRFSEAVGFDSSSLTVVGPHGERVDTGRAVHPDGDDHTVLVRLHAVTVKGSYLVIWRVVSADSHPGSGTFTFGYGAPAEPAPPPPVGDALVTWWHAAMRWLSLVGTVVLVGAGAFVTMLWPGGVRHRPVPRLLAAGWGAALVGTVGLFVLEGPYGAGTSVAGVKDTSLVAVTAGTLFGRLLLLRLVALGAATALWRSVRQGRAPGRWDLVGLALVTVESFSFGGHPGQGDLTPVATTLDALHLAAAAVWLGGLAVLGVSLATRGDELASVLPRWSRVAATCVLVLALTGAYQAWRGVRTPPAATTTDYGRLVLVKVLLFTGLLVVALVGRRRLSRRSREGSALVRPVVVELGLGVVVLGVSAVLVSSMPAWQAYRPQHTATVGAVTLTGERLVLQVRVGPTRPGLQTLDLHVTDGIGRPAAFDSASAVLTNPELGLGPIAVALTGDGRGAARAEAVAVPAPGRWQLVVYLRTSVVTTYVARDTYQVEQ
jgi:copper transport protein